MPFSATCSMLTACCGLAGLGEGRWEGGRRRCRAGTGVSKQLFMLDYNSSESDFT